MGAIELEKVAVKQKSSRRVKKKSPSKVVAEPAKVAVESGKIGVEPEYVRTESGKVAFKQKKVGAEPGESPRSQEKSAPYQESRRQARKCQR